MTAPLTLAAIRFTDDIPRMRRFLETLGLATARSWGAGMDVLRSASGEVWLHSTADSAIGAPVGCTQLTGRTADADVLREQMTAAGFEAAIVDEAYARTVEVTDPLGDTLVINDEGDGYGSTQHETEPDGRTSVSLCRFTDPQGDYVAFAEALGLRRDGENNEWYVPYTAGAGILGLHHDEGAPTLPGAGLGAGVTLGLTTSMPLEEVQQRLRDGGYDPGTVVTEDFGSRVETVDPDGQPLQIHGATTRP